MIDDPVAARARDWRHAAQAAVCDVLEPWAHGTVVRATRYPGYYDFNLVRVEDDPGMSVDELVSFADEALADMAHRRFDFDLIDVADALRPEFEARGWRTLRLVWMRHELPAPPGVGSEVEVEKTPYDAVNHLRVAWFKEEMPDQEIGDYHREAREVALARGAEVFVLREGDQPVAFAQLERAESAAEITQVYVHPDRRGRGLGTALTCAAIEAAGDVQDLWICADDEARAKDLYATLGFRPAWWSMEVTRLPS